MGILSPHFQPNGQIVEIDSELLDALQNGYPTLGWDGDPLLFLAYNRATDRIEVWRHNLNRDGKPGLVMQSKPGQRIADMNIIKVLMDHDTRRTDVAANIQKHNDKVRKDQLDAQRDKMGDAAERLYHGFQTDIGHHLTGSTRDFHPLPDAPWKADNESS